jgi:hypothetical protein
VNIKREFQVGRAKLVAELGYWAWVAGDTAMKRCVYVLFLSTSCAPFA